MTFCLRWHSLCSLWIQSAFLYEAVSPVNLFWLEWKAGKPVVVNLFWWNVRRWKAGTKLQIIPSEWVQQMQIHPSAKQIKASKGTYHLRSLWRCINKWQLIIVNAKSLKTQGSYHLQSIWELVSRRGVFENLSSFMWSHFPISSSHLREVSILLLWQTFCKRRPLLFKTPSINWKTESLFNLKKKEISAVCPFCLHWARWRETKLLHFLIWRLFDALTILEDNLYQFTAVTLRYVSILKFIYRILKPIFL